MAQVSASIALGTEGSRVTEMRWLADELDDFDDGFQPYKEGNVYICRNCAIEMTQRQALCGWCRRNTRRGQNAEVHRAERLARREHGEE